MSTIGSENLNLADLANRMDPSGGIADIFEVLSEENQIVNDAVAVMGNLTTGHKGVQRAGLPAVYYRRLNQGVPTSKSRTVPVEEPCALMTAFSQIDAEIINLAADKRKARFTEDRAFMDAMSQKAAETLFYGNKNTESEAFSGLSVRYSDPSAAVGENMINAGGLGSDNTSVWLVTWDERKTHLIFPKNTVGGLVPEDHGKQIVTDDDGNKFTAWVTEFNWRLGLFVGDWRYNARICNIDISALDTIGNTKNLITWMIQASERLPKLGAGRSAWYVNRTIREKLRLGIQEKIASNLTWETVAGKRVMMFDDIPVGRCDQLLNTEEAISFA
jgi:hypothetical protein